MPTLTHPKLPGQDIECTDEQVEVHALSGWVLKSDKATPATAPAKAPKGQPSTPNPTTSPSVGEEH